MPRRYEYQNMTVPQLEAALEETGLSIDDLVYLAGLSQHKGIMMMQGVEPDGEIPHMVTVLLALLTLPEAVDTAYRVTNKVTLGIIRGRQIYDRMQPWDLHRALQEQGLSKRQLAKITGLNEQKVDRMLSGEADSPHAVRVILALLKLPNAWETAIAVTNAMIIGETTPSSPVQREA